MSAVAEVMSVVYMFLASSDVPQTFHARLAPEMFHAQKPPDSTIAPQFVNTKIIFHLP